MLPQFRAPICRRENRCHQRAKPAGLRAFVVVGLKQRCSPRLEGLFRPEDTPAMQLPKCCRPSDSMAPPRAGELAALVGVEYASRHACNYPYVSERRLKPIIMSVSRRRPLHI